MIQEVIKRLLSFPQRGQIRINCDLKKKIFKLSVPIFSSKKLPGKIKEYVEARKKIAFKPHATSYQLDGEKIFLIQEIPFHLDFQTTSRGEIDQFWQMSKYCHKLLAEMAIEEVYKNAFRNPF